MYLRADIYELGRACSQTIGIVDQKVAIGPQSKENWKKNMDINNPLPSYPILWHGLPIVSV